MTTYKVPADAFRRDRTGTDHLTIEGRLARLESWMRDEIFARTSMDEPDPEPMTANEERERFTRLHDAVPVLIDLGLVVSPDDLRLQPLTATDELVDLICDCLGWNPRGSYRFQANEVTRAVVAHLNNERSAPCQTGTGPATATRTTPSAGATRRSGQ